MVNDSPKAPVTTGVMVMLIILLACCDNLSNNIILNESKPYFSSFAFLKKDNCQLDNDVICEIMGADTINLFVPYLTTDSLIPSFSGNFVSAEVGGIIQKSGETRLNFNNPITYKLTDARGNVNTVVICLIGYHGIPIINICTVDSINSKTEYVDAHLTISNSPSFGICKTTCKIKGRGNYTWKTYPKKPYKIKLDSKSSIFGFPANKDWVLLAEYCDRSLLRTAYFATVSESLEMLYTINYQHVELYINGEYQGVYILTDQVEKAKERVNIENDGFLFENDRYWSEEVLWFVSNVQGIHYTFKYPNAEKGIIVEGDDNYLFLKNRIDSLEYRLKKGNVLMI